MIHQRTEWWLVPHLYFDLLMHALDWAAGQEENTGVGEVDMLMGACADRGRLFEECIKG
jgi:hypothetical protein